MRERSEVLCLVLHLAQLQPTPCWLCPLSPCTLGDHAGRTRVFSAAEQALLLPNPLDRSPRAHPRSARRDCRAYNIGPAVRTNAVQARCAAAYAPAGCRRMAAWHARCPAAAFRAAASAAPHRMRRQSFSRQSSGQPCISGRVPACALPDAPSPPALPFSACRRPRWA